MWSCASNTSEKIRKAMDMRLYEIWPRTNDHPCIGRARLIVTAVFMAKCKCMEPPCVQNLTQKRRLHIISSWSSCMCALTSCASIRSDKRYLRPWDLWSTHRISFCRTFSCFETRPKWPKLQWTSFSYNLQLQFSSLNFNSRPPPHGGVWVLFRKDGLNNPSIQWDVPGWESLTKHSKSVPSEPMTNVQTLHSSVFHADRSSCDNLLFSSLNFPAIRMPSKMLHEDTLQLPFQCLRILPFPEYICKRQPCAKAFKACCDCCVVVPNCGVASDQRL